jgi:hypothetical protein
MSLSYPQATTNSRGANRANENHPHRKANTYATESGSLIKLIHTTGRLAAMAGR